MCKKINVLLYDLRKWILVYLKGSSDDCLCLYGDMLYDVCMNAPLVVEIYEWLL